MKIAMPISHYSEVEPLIAAGADEIYFGMIPLEWAEHYGMNSLNRRTSGNLNNFNELRYVVETTHSLGKRVSLTFNAQKYTEQQMSDLLGIAKYFANVGGNSFIVSDVGFIATLANEKLGPRIHASSIATCRNNQAMLFYKELGASRIVFPRYITLDEVKSIVFSVPMLEYEVFIQNDGCPFEEGLCQTIHLPNQLGGPICMDNYQINYQRTDGKNLSEAEAEILDRNEDDYNKWLWFKFSCGFTVNKDGYPYGPCGICAIPFFKKCGIAAIKIAGREFPLERKLKSLELVRSVLDKMDSGLNEQEIAVFGQGIRGKRDCCETGYMCYYPDVLDHLSNQK